MFSFLIRVLFYLIFYGTPLVGFWLASSVAAYLGGPHWMPWAAGALLFPIVPGIWELHAWSHAQPKEKAWFTPFDRLSLRTFVVGLAFLAALLWLYPQTAFVSLSTRGDWMLDGVKDSRANSARQFLFAAAGGLEWLYRATKKNPYKDQIDKLARQRTEESSQQLEQELARQHKKETIRQAAKQQDQEQAQPDEEQRAKQPEQDGTAISEPQDTEASHQAEDETAREQPQQGTQKHKQEAAPKHEQETLKTHARQAMPITIPDMDWPWKQATLHNAVATMPPRVETSIKSVAQYISQKERNPVLRIKALHDYVANRIAYDADAFFSGQFPAQDAQSVFKKRKGVCAGYANLLSALAAAINEQIVVVTGDARDQTAGDKLTGIGHAWNAARIGGRWYLIDACWDAGHVSREKGFTKCYGTDYLLPPALVMIKDHFPDAPTWQLLNKPLTLGEFLRQPMLRPSFQAEGLLLVAPQRAQNETGSKAVAIVKNPRNSWLMAQLEQHGTKIGSATDPTNSDVAELECELPSKGTYRLNMFANNQEQFGQYKFVGSIDFVNRQ